MKIRLFYIVFFLFSVNVMAGIDEKNQAEIDYLIAYVKNSECIFNRNDVDYKGSEAVEHMQRKSAYYEDEIITAEDFITLSATKSVISGKKYTVRCNGDKEKPLGQWLLDILGDYRQQGR